jgi:hypothetical protein
MLPHLTLSSAKGSLLASKPSSDKANKVSPRTYLLSTQATSTAELTHRPMSKITTDHPEIQRSYNSVFKIAPKIEMLGLHERVSLARKSVLDIKNVGREGGWWVELVGRVNKEAETVAARYREVWRISPLKDVCFEGLVESCLPCLVDVWAFGL